MIPLIKVKFVFCVHTGIILPLIMKTTNFDTIINRQNTNSIKWDKYAEDILPLWVADMDFPVPPEVIQAIEKRLSHPVLGYSGADEELLDIICAWVSRRHGWKIAPEQILLMAGVVNGINWTARTFATSESNLLIQTPVYPPFFRVAGNAGMQMLESSLCVSDSCYEIDFEDFEQKVSMGAKVFVLCNPHNPVGRVFKKSELEKLGEICLRNDVIICSDEIHCDLIYTGQKHIPIASISEELAQQTVTLMAASKTFNIPGLHFSFAIVPNENHRQAMQTAGAGMIGHPSFLANEAAKAAFTKCDDWLEQLLSYLEENRDYVIKFVSENIPGIKMFCPQGTYLAWLDCREMDFNPDPHQFFLNEARVALNDGKTFGINGTGFVRLNFGCPQDTLKEALDRMARAVLQRK